MTLSGSRIMVLLCWGEGENSEREGRKACSCRCTRDNANEERREASYMVYVYRQKGRTDLYWVLVIGVNSVVAVGAGEQRLTLPRLTLYWAFGSNSGRYLDQY